MYLTQVANVSWTAAGDAGPIAKDIDTLHWIQNRTRAVAETTIDRHTQTDRITTGSVDVYVEVTGYCTEYRIETANLDLLVMGGCGCRDG